ncbi:response regulator FixJ [Methylobacterium nodulans]|uniref:Two component transcriptional regulator, LuxR family n=1 Tax=Methylobacterium nodulans (strain LMG 21967 / CNCM I-2342 / ORS 2060) TaxID=460265 RepID=B8IUN4_METNO|nr:response regulator FixJ [Methylobacterium nodulans]ACL57102.1 two component transcriptional regulator, LuxR family [Methylobacterium nodulans ORS 2060]
MSGEAVVHVVDDDLAVRQSLAFLLASDGLPVRLHESATAFLDSMAEVTGCIVTDIRMPGVDGIELLRRLKQWDSPPPVIVMTGHADVPLAVEAMKQGAVDFIEKPFDDDAFLAAVRSALDRSRRSAVHDEVVSAIVRRIASLSQRERQVMDELVAGKANKVIGRDLGISPRTVEIHRANLMAKMQAGSLSELVRMALAAERHRDG